ncbi:MAG: serine/threonine protein kinase, partial [Holophagales bacterium]|nr:serine/threonine protein kinase [Holophagales bacterium]
LAAHDGEGRLAVEARVRDDSDGPDAPGRSLGPYQLVERIGRGGMGEVWLAERDEAGYRRRVAIKRIRRGLESEELLARFRVERQALARLSHRSIARLLDAGIDPEGVPYLVLENVDGRPITEACDAERLPLERRLELFEEICRAVAFAHANLIVHRDLKPSNILLTGGGEVRLLDFGIAKILDPDSGAAGLPETRTLAALATPEYASPEQVAGGPVTTATDVHALGALLYELLTGRRPFAAHESSSLGLARAIVEVDPPRPSESVTSTSEPERSECSKRATARATTPRELGRALAGDLDTIVGTALAKDPARRYPSVERLGEDVASFRSGHPIRARPDSIGYRFGKFVRRHRVAAVAVALAAVAVLAAGVQTVRQSAAVARERDAARQERDAAREVTDFLVSLFEADPYASGEQARDATTLGEFLESSEDAVRAELADRPELRARLLTLLGRLSANVGRLDAALELAREGVAERRRLLGPDHPDVAESLNVLGTALQERGDYDAAERALREALEIRERKLGELHGDTLESLNNLAVVLSLRDRPGDEAEEERLERLALERRRRLFGDHHLETAQSLNNLAVFLYNRSGPGDLEGAAEHLGEALAIREKALGADHPFVANTRSNLANVLLALGRTDEAVALFREAIRAWTESLGAEHARVAAGWWGLSRALESAGDLEGALDAARRTAAIDAVTLPPGHPDRDAGPARVAELEARLAADHGAGAP